MKTLKRILGVLLIFLFGVFIGAAISSAGAMQKLRETLIGGPEAVMDVIVKRLDHELKLDAEQKRKLQAIMDRVALKLPVFGTIIEKATIARWARTLSTMFAAGVPLVDLLVASGLASSKSDARRGIQGKGFAVNGEKTDDVERILTETDLRAGGYVMLQKGKKNYALLKVE